VQGDPNRPSSSTVNVSPERSERDETSKTRMQPMTTNKKNKRVDQVAANHPPSENVKKARLTRETSSGDFDWSLKESSPSFSSSSSHRSRSSSSSSSSGEVGYSEPVAPRKMFAPHGMLEEMTVFYEFLVNGIDAEDISYLNKSYEGLLEQVGFVWFSLALGN